MERITHHLLTLLVFVASLILYTMTLAPGLLWGGGDFATFQTLAFLGGVKDIRGGSAIFYHPLWVILAHPFTWLPIQNPAWRANFASAIFAAAALTLVFLTARRLSQSLPASLLATAALAVSHTFWTYAVMAKVYSLNALLLIAGICLLLRWREEGRGVYLYVFALLYGLSFLNHLVMATAAGGFFAYIGITVWQRRRQQQIRRQLLFGLLAGAVGLVPYFLLTSHLGSSGEVGGKIVKFFQSFTYLFSHPRTLLFGIVMGLLLFLYQYPVSFLPGFFGIYQMVKKRAPEFLLLGLIAAGNILFLLAALDPSAGGIYWWNLHYYLLTYIVFALWIAVGLAAVWTRLTSGKGRLIATVFLVVLSPILLYATVPTVARHFADYVPGFRLLPGRNNYTYALSPWKQHETGARAMGENILNALPPDSILFADYSIWAVVNYLQVVEGQRPDVQLVLLPGKTAQMPIILSYQNHENLFLADTYPPYYDMDGIEDHFEIIRDGPVYRLKPKNS
jgi:hypothetical protein